LCCDWIAKPMRYSLIPALVAVAFGQEKPLEFDGQMTTISQTHGPFAAPWPAAWGSAA
jgi:hypothetical protein